KLLKERIGNGPLPDEVTESDARAYYESHLSEFGTPDKAVIAILYVKNVDKARAVKAEAEQAVNESSGALQGRFDAFRVMVKKYTEEEGARDVTISVGLPPTVPRQVADAAVSLKDVGGLSSLIEAEQGYYLLQLKERIPGVIRPFQDVKSHALRSASERARDRKVAALVAELTQKAGVEVFNERFASLRFEDGSGARASADGEGNSR
ncbi:MAG TPA: peptidylprolyl isomerase, partial [Polyangiaceae bacterium]